MTDAARQKTRREKVKKEGLVDIRIEVPSYIRETLKEKAASKGKTLKQYLADVCAYYALK